MAFDPRTRKEVYQSLKANLSGRIPELTNFVQNTFNYVWTQAYSQQLHKQEVAAAAVQLSGWADYVGKEVTEDDLEDLGIEGAEPEEINQFVSEGHLDQFATAFGVTRDPGTRAAGKVEVKTTQSTKIPKGTEFGTQPDASGDYLSFFTTEQATTDKATTVTIDIVAEDIGNEYNVGSNTITYMPNPPTGVDSVTNPNSTSGGKNRQTNPELRQDVKNAVVESTQGGTTDGISGFIEQNTDATSVIVDQKFTGDSEHGSYPHADVIVLGGSSANVQDAIDHSHPSGVEHILERPQVYNVNIEAKVRGNDIDTSEVSQEISEYFNSLLLGEDVIRDKLIQIVMNADEDILNISNLNVEVSGETATISGELVDDFEDGDITVADGDWSGWSGSTGALTAQTTTVLSGSYSAELAAANAANTVTATRSSTVSTPAQWNVQIDNQTTNSGDSVQFEFASGTTTLGYLEFDGAGNINWYNGASNAVTTWSAATTYEPFLDFDFANDQVTIKVNGTSTTLALQNAVSGYDTINVTNDTTASTGTVNTYFDKVKHFDLGYNLGKGEQMESDGITAVDDASGDAYTEDTDFAEADPDGDGDPEAIKWLGSGSEPDVAEDFYVTYAVKEDIPVTTKEVAQLNNANITVV